MMRPFDGTVWLRHALRVKRTTGLVDRAVLAAVVVAGGRPTLAGLAEDSGLGPELVAEVVAELQGEGLLAADLQAVMPEYALHELAELKHRQQVLGVRCTSCRARPLDPCRSKTTGGVVPFHAPRLKLSAVEVAK